MDRKKIAIIFLIVIGILFIVAMTFGFSEDDSNEDADENYEPPAWISSLGDWFGSGDPIKPGHLRVVKGKATIKNDMITVKSKYCVIRVRSSKKDFRSCKLVLQEIPEAAPKKKGDEQVEEKPPMQKIEVQYEPKGSSAGDKKAKALELTLADEDTAKIAAQEKGGEIQLTLKEGELNYVLKIK